jgi:processing peptidase subunit alpha
MLLFEQSPDFASTAVDLAAGELLEVATPGKGSFFFAISKLLCFKIRLTIISCILFVPGLLPHIVTQEQLDRAKEATKAAVLMNLESRVYCSFS